jgi:hypothetical protein
VHLSITNSTIIHHLLLWLSHSQVNIAWFIICQSPYIFLTSSIFQSSFIFTYFTKTKLHIHNFINTYSFIHPNGFRKLNINFEDVSWFIEKVMIKLHEKCNMTYMCSILIITQVIEGIMESNQSPNKYNIHIYNFYVYTETQFKTENCAKFDFSQLVWQIIVGRFLSSQKQMKLPKIILKIAFFTK